MTSQAGTTLPAKQQAKFFDIAPAEPLNHHVAHALAVRTHVEAFGGATLRALSTAHGAEQVQHIVQAAVSVAMTAYAPARRMSGEQIVMFASQIMEEYPHESLADVRFFARCAASAQFDHGETFGAIDVPLMRKWWQKHLDNKAEALERMRKSDNNALNPEWGKHLSKIVDPRMAEAMKAGAEIGKAEEPPKTDRVNELALLRVALPDMSVEQLRQAYKIHKGQERSIVLMEAKRRGLMGKEAQAAQAFNDRQDAERAQEANDMRWAAQQKLFNEAGITTDQQQAVQ